MFKRIMDEKPEVLTKIHIVNGEITSENLGLSNHDMKYVIDKTQMIFHLAASLRLEATLRPNILANLTATKQVIYLAKQMNNLLLVMYVSTAFCNVDHVEIEEKVYDLPQRPMDLIRSAKEMTDEGMANLQKLFLGAHPNTYTYTKRLAEILVRDEYESSNLPLCIVRPSIVGPTLREPVVGWIDTLNGPPGIIIAATKGVLRCMLINRDAKFNMIPCDVSINAFILIGKEIGNAISR